MEYIYSEIMQRLPKPEERLSCIIIVPSEAQAAALQKHFSCGPAGPLPQIIPWQKLSTQLLGQPQPQIDRLNALVDTFRTARKLAPTFPQQLDYFQKISHTLRVAERYGMAAAEPFAVQAPTPQAEELWNICTTLYASHYAAASPWKALRAVESSPVLNTGRAVWWVDACPNVHFTALDNWRAYIQSLPTGHILQPAAPLQTHFSEFITTGEEILSVATQIATTQSAGVGRIAVFCHNTLARWRLQAELNLLGIAAEDRATSLPPPRAFTTLEALARWQTEPTYRNLFYLLGATHDRLSPAWCVVEEALAKALLLPSRIHNGQVLYPADYTPETALPEKCLAAASEQLDKLWAELRPFSSPIQPFAQFLQEQKTAWKALWKELAEETPPFPLLFPTADLGAGTAAHYLRWLACVDEELPPDATGPAGGGPISLYSPRQALQAQYDQAFCMGVSEDFWFGDLSFGVFFRPPALFQKALEQDLWNGIHWSSIHPPIITRAQDQGLPHALLDGLRKIEQQPSRKRTVAHPPGLCASPPIPKPHLPRDLSVTDIQWLQDDPYGFYARKILHLLPAAEHSTSLDYGKWAHFVLNHYFAQGAYGRGESLVDFARSLSTQPLTKRQFFPRIQAILKELETKIRADPPSAIQTEQRLERHWDGKGGRVRVYGIADRIDHWSTADKAHTSIIDYKTGSLPSTSQLSELSAPQLPLEAWMLCGQTGWANAPITLRLQRLRADSRVASVQIEASEAFCARVHEWLTDLLSNYPAEDRVFSPNPNAKNAAVYAHLERTLQGGAAA